MLFISVLVSTFSVSFTVQYITFLYDEFLIKCIFIRTSGEEERTKKKEEFLDVCLSDVFTLHMRFKNRNARESLVHGKDRKD